MSGLVANVWRFFVFAIALATILGMLGLNLTPLLASATIIGATLGFGAQQLIRDYFSGFLITVEDQFSVGETIVVGETSGVVEDVSMRVTKVRGSDGTLYFIPNGDIRLLANTSRGWSRASVDLILPAAAAADLDDVRRITEEAAHRVAQRPEFAERITEPRLLVGVVSTDATTMTLRVTLHTVPSLRDPLTRALREEAIADLARAGYLADTTGT
jgi:small conductance mechanosensitive channel